jgi:hypothetical protein
VLNVLRVHELSAFQRPLLSDLPNQPMQRTRMKMRAADGRRYADESLLEREVDGCSSVWSVGCRLSFAQASTS